MLCRKTTLLQWVGLLCRSISSEQKPLCVHLPGKSTTDGFHSSVTSAATQEGHFQSFEIITLMMSRWCHQGYLRSGFEANCGCGTLKVSAFKRGRGLVTDDIDLHYGKCRQDVSARRWSSFSLFFLKYVLIGVSKLFCTWLIKCKFYRLHSDCVAYCFFSQSARYFPFCNKQICLPTKDTSLPVHHDESLIYHQKIKQDRKGVIYNVLFLIPKLS